MDLTADPLLKSPFFNSMRTQLYNANTLAQPKCMYNFDHFSKILSPFLDGFVCGMSYGAYKHTNRPCDTTVIFQQLIA